MKKVITLISEADGGKIRKALALLVSVLVIFTLVGCGGVSKGKSDDIDSELLNTVEETDDVDSKAPDSNDSQWKQFIKKYNAWVDKYIDLMKKYKANPTDVSVLSDYTKMVSEMNEWTEESQKITDQLDTDEALEFAAELTKIAERLAEVATDN